MKRVPICTVVALGLAILPTGASAANGPSLWSQSGCGGCHTLSAAGSTGNAGPDLDALQPSSAAVAAQVSSGGPGMPSFAGSLSSSEIQQLADWVASSTGGASSAGGTATTQSPNASLPAATVLKLQRDLHRLGCFKGPFTGFFGPITTRAVKRFQRTHGLLVDGIWGPQSQSALTQALRLGH